MASRTFISGDSRLNDALYSVTKISQNIVFFGSLVIAPTDAYGIQTIIRRKQLMTRHLRSLILLSILVMFCAPDASRAELVRFEVVEVESPYFDGRSFGSVGQYEMITARATIAVDPEHALNSGIVDIDLAPTNESGRVEAIADVAILRPVDLSKGSGRLFYEVLNRGDKISFILMNDAPWVDYYQGLDAANGHLMNEGYTVVWSGWQGDMPAGENRMRLQAPVVENITGTVRDEFIFNHNYDPFVATLSYPAASLDTDKATLTVRARQTDPRVTPDDLAFEFFTAERAGIAPYTNEQIVIHRPAGFDASAIYEFTYEARDPIVMGLAFATVRDLISFLRNDSEDDAGNANPLLLDGKPATQYTYGMGISQSGRFVRDFLYQGFNEDEQGRMVFDGLMPDVAGSRKTWTNYRFAQPGRYSQEHEAHLQPGDQFPFTYGVMRGPSHGKDGRHPQTLPGIRHLPEGISHGYRDGVLAGTLVTRRDGYERQRYRIAGQRARIPDGQYAPLGGIRWRSHTHSNTARTSATRCKTVARCAHYCMRSIYGFARESSRRTVSFHPMPMGRLCHGRSGEYRLPVNSRRFVS